MKKLFLILAAATLMTACGNKENNHPNTDNQTQDSTSLTINSEDQALHNAISDYLVKEVGTHYLQGELCIPELTIVATDKQESEQTKVWGDFWVFWYNQVGDTLKCVSGGNHAGLMTLTKDGDQYKVTSFEQTVDGAGNVASAKRIFGDYFDIYQNIHSCDSVRESARKEQLHDYVKQNNLNAKYFQDYGWPAVALEK